MLKLNKAVAGCLSARPDHRMKAREIAEHIYRAHPAECAAKSSRSAALRNEADLLQHLVAEIGARRPLITKPYPQIKTTEGRPRRYFWTASGEEAQAAGGEAPAKAERSTAFATESSALEVHLYPKLREFLRAGSGLFVQRIDEKRSSNRRGPQGIDRQSLF